MTQSPPAQYGERAGYRAAPREVATFAAASAHLDIYQGDDYAAVVEVTDAAGAPADLTGVTPKAQIRTEVADLQPLVTVEIDCTLDLPDKILLAIPHADTADLNGPYVWDLQLTLADGTITTILAGTVTATPEVTRP